MRKSPLLVLINVLHLLVKLNRYLNYILFIDKKNDNPTLTTKIRQTTNQLENNDILGVSSGRNVDKKTWWWNEEVQIWVQRRRAAKKKWDSVRTDESDQE